MALHTVLLVATFFFLHTTCEPVSTENVAIVGGHNVHIQDVPFIAAVLQDGSASCVGTIVHKSFILTSASCSSGGQKQTVLVGTARLNRGGALHKIKEAICHHHYDADTGVNDICLLKLKTTLQFGRRVTRVRLPDPHEQIPNVMFNVTGWGSLDSEGKNYPTRLQQVTVPLISNEDCNKVYGDVADTMICASSPGHDGCMGDTGAPLTNKNVQFGLFSRVNSAGCGKGPSVYTKLTPYTDWINLMITMYSD